MTTAEHSYTTVDKSSWGAGPWISEPDKIQWVDEATGLDCLLVRNRLGALCGYVGVPRSHSWHGKGYGERVAASDDEWDGCIDAIIEVHGGLTYSDTCQEDAAEATGVCHIPAPGQPGDVWWFGFDCAHCCDFVPGMTPPMPAFEMEVYRDVSYVRRECTGLARQLHQHSTDA